ncbi:MAG: hypothetical protein AAGE59_09395 [Cyanobacteria bacterium P01_F01_bin.86]
MTNSVPGFILLFLDGVGLGRSQPQNPLADPQNTPFLSHLLGTSLVIDSRFNTTDSVLPTSSVSAELWIDRAGLLAKPIDACLGVPGYPQSATGQTTLYTGQNAAKFRGQHQTAFANGSLRQLIEAHGIFKQVLALGGTATLANLYSPAYFEAIAQRRIRYAVGTLLNLTAQLPFRMQAEYEQGEAIFWDITGEQAYYRGIAEAPITASEAGKRLALLGARHTITLFECFLTDFAGHAQDWVQAIVVLRCVDAFIQSVVEHLAPHTTLVITSDHGNLEDLATKCHTLNPVPLIAIGPDASAFRTAIDLTQVTPLILKILQRK